MENYLRQVIEGVSNTRGTEFFETICLKLDEIIHADFTFIARFDMDSFVSHTIAVVGDGKVLDNFEYSLTNTPCADLLNTDICCYPENVTAQFPHDQLLVDMGIVGYLGSNLVNSKGEVFGLITALYTKPIENAELTTMLLQVFSGRIAGELERCEYEASLEELNRDLEQKVQQRTAQLESTLDNLKLAQEKLIASEKLAVLGDLVTGIAHEVNTPLGIAVTAESHLTEASNDLRKRFDEDQLRKSDLEKFFTESDLSLQLISTNLDRASELINNVKQTAADQHFFHREKMLIDRYYRQVLHSLSPLIKKYHINITLACDPFWFAMTYPGAHAQVLTNLVKNSIQHGFQYDAGDINITVSAEGDRFKVDYVDSGRGVPELVNKRVFDPFVTTARAEGGIGLGMAIVNNVVSNTLKGTIELLPSEQGAHFAYYFSAG